MNVSSARRDRPAVDDREQQRDPEQQQRRQHADPEEPARADGQRDADAQRHEADVEGPAEPARHEHVGGDQEDAQVTASRVTRPPDIRPSSHSVGAFTRSR